MEQIVKKYKIKITDKEGNTQTIEIRSNDIEWSMEQYQRNREPFTWEIYKEYKNES